MNWWIVFITGLTTGGLSCLAMQGGLLSSIIANQKESELQTKAASLKTFDPLDWMPVGMFLVSKLIIHTIFGFLLGALGSTITLSLNVRLTFQIFTALFMLGTAMNLLEIHPIFRYLVLQPPRFINRLIRQNARNKAMFAPAILGIMTIFIPCGITQAMEILAVNTGNPTQGAIIMFAFVLGTSPVFAILGVATAKLSEGLQQNFMRIAAFSLILMSLYTINGVLVVNDSFFTFQKFTATVFGPPTTNTTQSADINAQTGIQKIHIDVQPHGYNPQYLTVKSGIPVELTLTSKDTYSCALAFTLREFNISEMLNPTDQKTITFTPTKPGNYTYTCSMGMYTGTLRVT